MWHMGVQEELDELKMEKREIKKKLQLVEDIMKEDLYTAYYGVAEEEEIVEKREIEIPGMEEEEDMAEEGDFSVFSVTIKFGAKLDFDKVEYINQLNCYFVSFNYICLKNILTASKNIFII